MAIIKLKTNEKFSHIIHLSDIHVRLTKRHQEYQEIFNKLYVDVKKTPETTAVFVLGDIVNSKIDLSPECVDLAADLLFNLASIRTTILVAGNHDTNLTNRNRMDSLSPIVDALNHPNLFYLKQSGLYSLGNICINNYSVFDSIESYIKGEDIPQIYRNQYEYFVCLFHGQVDGAITDLGFKLSNPSITTNTFDNHDIVLLGDIHLPQTLQEYDYQNNKPIIRFCGSIIQQTHAESIGGHGYTLWDLKSKTYKHIEIPNDYGFYSILITNGVITSNLTNLPKKARIRFQLTNTTPTEIKSALINVRQLTEVIESSYQKMDTGTTLTRIPTTNGNVVLGNINDKNYQTDLIKEYLKTKLKITDQTFIDNIIKINDIMNDVVKKDDFTRNIRWIPIRFEWENMFSYGENNVIDFTKAKDLIGFFASNASGKSSVFSAMTFCLFDKCEREYKAVNVMNVQKTEFNCKFEFEIDNKRYFIQRVGKSDKKGKVKVDVRFWKIENDKEIDLNGEQRKDTNEIIREYLGSYDDFVLTSLSVQNGKNNASIIDMGDTDRKDLFSQFMGLTMFDRLYTEANEQLKECFIMLKAYKNDDFTQKLVDYTNLLKQAEILYEEELKSSSSVNKTIKETRENILNETIKLIKVDIEISNISNIERLKKEIERDISDTLLEIENIEKTNKQLNENLSLIEKDIKELNDKGFVDSKEKYQKLFIEKNNNENTLEKLKLNYKHDLEIYKKSTELEYDPSCNFCVKNAGKVALDSKEASERMINVKDATINLNKINDKIKTELELLKWVITSDISYQKLLKDRNDNQYKVSSTNNKINSLNKSLLMLKECLKENENKIKLYNSNIESIKHNEIINKNIEDYNKKLKEYEYIFKLKNQSLMEWNSKISVLKNKISEINQKISEIKMVEEKYKLYEIYCQIVSRDGIPFDVITATVPEIQNEVNNILSQVCEFSSLFETDGKNIIPYIVYDDKKWLMILTSGFEKFALSLAIRVALINISNLPRPNFLIIDEGWSTLDAEHLSSLPSLFSYLKTNFDFIIIVSHNETIRDFVDNHIEITKDNGFSRVNFV